jgi:hypothetical protein
MPTRTTARIHLLPAKEAPVVVIIRRKPSKVFHVMRWNTGTDAIEHGSWFRGTLYPMRCDVAFDGNWMVYLAMGATGDTWNGLCKLPWLKTVSESENDGAWNGGGYWKDRRTLLTNGWSRTKGEKKLPFKLSPLVTEHGEDEGVLYPRMERDGWKRAGPFGKAYQPSAKHPTLRCFYRGHLEHGRTFEFSLEGYPGLLDRGVDWATWDSLGQLVVARSGAVEKYRLSDLPDRKPSFHLSLEDLGPPTGPVRTDRSHDWPAFDAPLLREIAEAFATRRKAIRNKTMELSCEREIDEQDGKPYERLNLRVALFEEQRTRIYLSIWEDSALWLCVHQPTKCGLKFKMEFHGTAESTAPADIVAAFEETIRIAYEGSRPPGEEAKQMIRAVWEPVSPS